MKVYAVTRGKNGDESYDLMGIAGGQETSRTYGRIVQR